MAIFGRNIPRAQARQFENARLAEARRWDAVRSRLEAGEHPLFNTPAKFVGIDGIDWNGTCYLTDRAILGDVAAGLRPYRWRLAFDEITTYQRRDFRLGIRSADRSHVMQLAAGPVADALLHRFLLEVTWACRAPDDQPF